MHPSSSVMTISLMLTLAACGGGGDGMGTPTDPGVNGSPGTDTLIDAGTGDTTAGDTAGGDTTGSGTTAGDTTGGGTVGGDLPASPAEPSGNDGADLPKGAIWGESPSLGRTKVNDVALDMSPEQITVRVSDEPPIVLDVSGQTGTGFNRYENDRGRALASRVGEETLGVVLDYTSYGVWFQSENADAGSFFGVKETRTRDIPVQGKATYAGGAVAALTGSADAITGAFKAEADFGAQSVSGGIDFDGGPDVDLGRAKINGNGSIVGRNVTAEGFNPGTVRGRFGGPEAQEMAGFFMLDGADGAAMRGAFGGKREEITLPDMTDGDGMTSGREQYEWHWDHGRWQ